MSKTITYLKNRGIDIAAIAAVITTIFFIANVVQKNTAHELNEVIEEGKKEIEELLVSMDKGVIAFASEECPDGWKPYQEASGRFLLGALEGEFYLGQKKGTKSHSHSTNVSGAHGGRRGGDNGGDFHASTPGHTHTVAVNDASHMPPYLVVKYCKRVSKGK
jgi:hypothetical protein